MSDLRAVSRWRTFPFNEHRSWSDVLLTEKLEARRLRGDLHNGEYSSLIRLQSRAVMPDSGIDADPDAA